MDKEMTKLQQTLRILKYLSYALMVLGVTGTLLAMMIATATPEKATAFAIATPIVLGVTGYALYIVVGITLYPHGDLIYGTGMGWFAGMSLVVGTTPGYALHFAGAVIVVLSCLAYVVVFARYIARKIKTPVKPSN